MLILAETHGTSHKWSFVVVGDRRASSGRAGSALKYLEWNFTHFVVTDDRVIFRTGVLAKHGVEIPMERINNINFHQGIWERVIGAGDLDIESAGKDGQSHFDDVWHPDGVQQELYRQMEANARKRAGWASRRRGAGRRGAGRARGDASPSSCSSSPTCATGA